MRYSDLGNQLKDSGLGELLALAGKPEMYNFSSGFPAEELFPLKELEEVNRAILQQEGKQACSTVPPQVICRCGSRSQRA